MLFIPLIVMSMPIDLPIEGVDRDLIAIVAEAPDPRPTPPPSDPPSAQPQE